MKTLFLLQAQYDGRAEIPLDKICVDLLSMKYHEAKRQAFVQKLPFPVHRLGTQKSPWMVSITDLAAYIDKQKAAAEALWTKMNEF